MISKFKNCIIIRYEDLIHNFKHTINKIKNCGLTIKNNIEYPININRDCKYSNTYNKDIKKYKKHIISKQVIINNTKSPLQLFYKNKCRIKVKFIWLIINDINDYSN